MRVGAFLSLGYKFRIEVDHGFSSKYELVRHLRIDSVYFTGQLYSSGEARRVFDKALSHCEFRRVEAVLCFDFVADLSVFVVHAQTNSCFQRVFFPEYLCLHFFRKVFLKQRLFVLVNNLSKLGNRISFVAEFDFNFFFSLSPQTGGGEEEFRGQQLVLPFNSHHGRDSVFFQEEEAVLDFEDELFGGGDEVESHVDALSFRVVQHADVEVGSGLNDFDGHVRGDAVVQHETDVVRERSVERAVVRVFGQREIHVLLFLPVGPT